MLYPKAQVIARYTKYFLFYMKFVIWYLNVQYSYLAEEMTSLCLSESNILVRWDTTESAYWVIWTWRRPMRTDQQEGVSTQWGIIYIMCKVPSPIRAHLKLSQNKLSLLIQHHEQVQTLQLPFTHKNLAIFAL